MDSNNKTLIKDLKTIVGSAYVLVNDIHKSPYCEGYRFGKGHAIAVVRPKNLVQLWQSLKACVKHQACIIMQAANTGLTGGSTPDGDHYDRSIFVINTMRIDDIHVLNQGKQIIGFAGSTLFQLEKKLSRYGREPHSVIGSSCIGASIVGGVCNNSGGALVKRGPAYTELSLFAKITKSGELILVNHLGIELGKDAEEILSNLQNKTYQMTSLVNSDKLASDIHYEKRVRNIDSATPSRYNADARRLCDASGCAGKIAVFAVRLDTFPLPKRQKVFYVGTNDPAVFTQIRRHILSTFKHLPVSGEYLHRDCYDATKKYGKDTFLVIEKMGSSFLPKLFSLKRFVDRITSKIKFLPTHFSDFLLQYVSYLLPNHLPSRMEKFRDKYEHHWVIEMEDSGIEEARTYFNKLFLHEEGAFFECSKKEEKKALLHRFVAGSAIGRYHMIHKKKVGSMMTMDIAFARNERNWFEKLPKEIEDLLDLKLYYGHLFCHVLHQNYIVKKGVDARLLKEKLLKLFDARGAEYPAEHNVGHEYVAKKSLKDFYQKLDPSNSFNPGIGKTSKNKNWE